MKKNKFTLILVFCVCVNLGFSQVGYISNLDSKYGVNKFKLEDSYLKYKNQTKLIEYSGVYVPPKKDTKEYYYTGKDIDKILDYSVTNIRLIFIKDKLAAVDVTFDNNLSDYQNKKIYEKLENLFGAPTASNPPGMYGAKFLHLWTSNKAQLLFTQQEGYFVGSNMMIKSIKLLMERDNDEF